MAGVNWTVAELYHVVNKSAVKLPRLRNTPGSHVGQDLSIVDNEKSIPDVV